MGCRMQLFGCAKRKFVFITHMYFVAKIHMDQPTILIRLISLGMFDFRVIEVEKDLLVYDD